MIYFILFYLFLERGKGRGDERERNIDVREKHRSVASCVHPDQGPVTWVCVLTGNQTGGFSVCGMTPNQLSHTGKGKNPVFTMCHSRDTIYICIICHSQNTIPNY